MDSNEISTNQRKSKRQTSPRRVTAATIVPNAVKEEIDSDSSEDSETECAAKYCRCPSDEQVGWVQCDKCQQWFHILCVGLTNQAAEAMDVFVCADCITFDCNNVNETIDYHKSTKLEICSNS
ncbi:uncharacterized protein TRIADDRAFT_55483 [Trichoplax adhaerens]|uniref:Zinc finger PHD-type domain-containing protein n=1 Tax=Trichoplax adhaerens TaxID=10228 RepID=B3RV06_TRIAD|nr:hypothetical protein TRIADDRAFT_55483 [Trichoplax adhaerens]EDV25411.1 hypothetical protein TRIADDRAFT_55483 [Trichoplax adhaerens]|eukprot:XP_002111444.1 hypothetical protein TRIADDRAFT_55483 [Trichoplax adhaerens]